MSTNLVRKPIFLTTANLVDMIQTYTRVIGSGMRRFFKFAQHLSTLLCTKGTYVCSKRCKSKRKPSSWSFGIRQPRYCYNISTSPLVTCSHVGALFCLEFFAGTFHIWKGVGMVCRHLSFKQHTNRLFSKIPCTRRVVCFRVSNKKLYGICVFACFWYGVS